jgi:hypothetical protein
MTDNADLMQAAVDAAQAASEAASQVEIKAVAAAGLSTTGTPAETAASAAAAAATQAVVKAKGAVTKIKVAAAQERTVSLSVIDELAPTQKELDEQQRVVNRWHVGTSCIVVTLACLWLLNRLLVYKHLVLIPHDFPSECFAFGVVIIVDGYLCLLLVGAAYRCRHREPVRWFLRLPDRGPAAFVLLFQFVALVLAFARINQYLKLTASTQESLYEAFLTVAALSHEHYIPTTAVSRLAVAGELFSVLSLIFVFFPLLIARLAMFKDETVSPLKFRFRLEAGDDVAWIINDLAGLPKPKHGKRVELNVDEAGVVDFHSPT